MVNNSKLTNIQHVVHVIYSGLGGHAAVMFSLIEGGFYRGAEHHVVLAGVEKPLADYTQRLEALGISWDYVEKEPSRGHLRFYRKLRDIFKRKRPDLIFLNGLASVPAVTGLNVLPGKYRPTTLLRESEPVQLKTRFEWTILALAHFTVDEIVHLTPEAARGARNVLRWLYRDSKVSLIPNGIDTDYFKPRKKPRNGEPLRIGMVSRLQHKKDHFTLLNAFDKVRRLRPDRDMILHIAGDGDTRTAIESEIARLSLGDVVVMHGLLNRTEIRDFLKRLDIYIHATFGETMSNSIMQAMATRLPIIASDVNGVSNMIGNEYGVLYPSKDCAALQHKILQWIDNPAEAEEYAVRARERAETEYNISRVIERYEDLVRESRCRRVNA